MGNSFYQNSRMEWRRRRFRSSINFNFFVPMLEFVAKIIIVVFSVWYINYCLQPLKHLEQYATARELKRQEEYIIESQEKEMKSLQDYVERTELKKAYEQEELFREQHQNEIKECAQKFKIGDRIKIYDFNAPMVQIEDKYRWSIGDIDTIVNIVGLKIYCESGNIYSYNEQIDKVRSKREWRDLVYMKLNGELYFVDDNDDAP